MSKKLIRTETDLDKAVDALPETEVRDALKQIASLWFLEDDSSLNFDKELGSDHLEAVTQILSGRGIYPSK